MEQPFSIQGNKMTLTPEEIHTRSAQAEEAFKNQDYSQSVSLLTGITQANPDYAPAYLKLGYIWMRTDTPHKALPYLNKAIELAPDDAANWSALGYYYQKVGALPEAIHTFGKSLELSGENEPILYELFKIHKELKYNDKAISLMQKLLQINPDAVHYRWEYGQLLEGKKSLSEALEEYTLIINSANTNIPVDAIKRWYALMLTHKRHDEAHRWFYTQIQNNPGNAVLKWLYGKSFADKFQYDDALSMMMEAQRLDPTNAEFYYSIATIYYILGDKNNALDYYDKVLAINPLHSVALRSKGIMHQYVYGDEAFGQLNFAAAYLPEMSVSEKTQLHYALGKAYDDVKEYATAFEHYKRGGIFHADGNQEEYKSLLMISKAMQEVMTSDAFAGCDAHGCLSKKPIFVLGMPRSGTTLIEQVLSSLDGVYGAGELSFATDVLNEAEIAGKRFHLLDKAHYPEIDNAGYKERGERYLSLLEALAPPGTKRIIDKMPDNFKFVGLIHLMLPKASIIHSRRHPVETCLSAYRLHFTEGHYWSDDLKVMGQYYRQYAQLMDLWKRTLPEGAMLEVRYEDMIGDLETESKRLAAFAGVEWSDTSMQFHQSKRAVTTASATQVRQPIYQSSLNRWRKYEPYLKPLLDEIGDLVEAYEKELEHKS